MTELPRAGSRPTTRELMVLAALYETSSQSEAAVKLGISTQGVHNRLQALYARLEVHSSIEAGVAIGWIVVPSERETCGWLGRCGRNRDHRGQHGGFRQHVCERGGT